MCVSVCPARGGGGGGGGDAGVGGRVGGVFCFSGSNKEICNRSKKNPLDLPIDGCLNKDRAETRNICVRVRDGFILLVLTATFPKLK